MNYVMATSFATSCLSTPFSPSGIATWPQASAEASAPDGTSTEDTGSTTGPEISSGSDASGQVHASMGAILK